VTVTFDEIESKTKVFEPVFITPTKTDLNNCQVLINLEFQGHYGEPDFLFNLDLSKLEMNKPQFYFFEFVPSLMKWTNFKAIEL